MGPAQRDAQVVGQTPAQVWQGKAVNEGDTMKPNAQEKTFKPNAHTVKPNAR